MAVVYEQCGRPNHGLIGVRRHAFVAAPDLLLGLAHGSGRDLPCGFPGSLATRAGYSNKFACPALAADDVYYYIC